MIASNYRKFPEALLYQMELALADVRDTLQWIRVNAPTTWTLWTRRLIDAKPDTRHTKPDPQWWIEQRDQATELSRLVQKACLCLAI